MLKTDHENIWKTADSKVLVQDVKDVYSPLVSPTLVYIYVVLPPFFLLELALYTVFLFPHSVEEKT